MSSARHFDGGDVRAARASRTPHSPPPCAAFISTAAPLLLRPPPAHSLGHRACPAHASRRRPPPPPVAMSLRTRLFDALGDGPLPGGKEGGQGEEGGKGEKGEAEVNNDPPPGLMLSSLLAGFGAELGGSGALGERLADAKERLQYHKEQLMTRVAGGGGGDGGDGGDGGEGGDGARDADEDETLERLGGGSMGGAAAAAMRALGMGTDLDGEVVDGVGEEVDAVGVPCGPDFEPVTALVLAGYGFQAYLEPARGAYWEAHCATVAAAEGSGREEQSIMTRVAYPSTQAISATALGVFIVQCGATREEDGFKPLDTAFYVTTAVSGGGIYNGDVVSADGVVSFSLLRRGGKKKLPEGEQNFLSFYVYESEDSFLTGGAQLASGQYALDEIIDASVGQAGGARGGTDVVLFQAESAEDEGNFFQSLQLPKGMSLPFGLSMPSAKSAREKAYEKVAGASVTVQVSYMPFDMPAGYDVGADEDYDEDDEEEEEEEERVLSAEEEKEISDAMAHGDIPQDWQKLVKELHELITGLEGTSSVLPPDLVCEDLPASRFIMSPDTDSEVWMWHDEVKKHVIVSYRGTEQTKWKDFVTDSLVFLQAWTPGEDIKLEIEAGRTMGLDMWDVLQNGSKKGRDDDVSAMSCCHWGFLRAYLSLRECVNETLDELTDGFSGDYSIFFVGHSLGTCLFCW